MKPQNQEPENFSKKPLERGGQAEGARTPAGGSFDKTPGDGAAGNSGQRRSGRGSVCRLHTNELERLHGKSKGGNKAVEDELRRRGHNSTMLREAEWDHDQRRWREISKQAHEISRRQKKRVRRAKLKRKRDRRRERSRERQRQEQQARLDRLKEGVVIVGENYDPSAADGTCPF
jgi:hypothetical protein